MSESADPIKMIESMNAKLALQKDPLCVDDKPIHWMLHVNTDSVTVQDSGMIGPPFNFRALGVEEVPSEAIPELCRVVVEWLGHQIPESKGWACVEVEKDVS